MQCNYFGLSLKGSALGTSVQHQRGNAMHLPAKQDKYHTLTSPAHSQKYSGGTFFFFNDHILQMYPEGTIMYSNYFGTN